MNSHLRAVEGYGERPLYYHGGVHGLSVGDMIVPSPPHVMDGCYLCQARAAGRVVTVGEWRKVVRTYGERGRAILSMLEGLPDNAPVDPPRQVQKGVYLTTSLLYATWYAARSGHGDLYQVDPIGATHSTLEDSFPSIVAISAHVTRVLRRRVWLSRSERRELSRAWEKADKKHLEARS